MKVFVKLNNAFYNLDHIVSIHEDGPDACIVKLDTNEGVVVRRSAVSILADIHTVTAGLVHD